MQLLNKSDEHLILDDFNLHHFWWRSIRYLIKHYMMNDLIKIVKKIELQLLTLSDIITWKNCESAITVNLIFIFLWLTQWMTHCMMNSELENSSDHHLIILLFILNTISQILKQQCNWKKMNKKKIIVDMQYLCMFEFLNVLSDIKTYTDYLMNFIQQFMKLTVLLIKFIKKYSCSWWFSKVENVI